MLLFTNVQSVSKTSYGCREHIPSRRFQRSTQDGSGFDVHTGSQVQQLCFVCSYGCILPQPHVFGRESQTCSHSTYDRKSDWKNWGLDGLRLDEISFLFRMLHHRFALVIWTNFEDVPQLCPSSHIPFESWLGANDAHTAAVTIRLFGTHKVFLDFQITIITYWASKIQDKWNMRRLVHFLQTWLPLIYVQELRFLVA